MSDKGKKSGKSAAPSLPPLAPEDVQLLEAQVADLVRALDAGAAPETLKDAVTRRPHDPAWDLHLLERLAYLAHPAAPGLAAAWFGDAQDKARRKALKRTLHVLKSRGLAVSPDLLPREEATVLKTAAAPVSAHLSNIFNQGERYIILEGPAEVLGGTHLVARVSDREGFRECHLLSLRRKQWAEFWDQFKSHGLDEWAKAPPAYAVRLLEEALALTPPGDGGAQRYRGLRPRLHAQVGYPEAAQELSQLLPPVVDGERRRLLERTAELGRTSLFFSWLPTPEEIMPWLNKLREAESSPLVLSDLQQQARREAVVDDAVRAFYPPASRPAWGRRLLETAYFLDLKGRTEEARALQAAGEDLLSGQASALTGENPFLRGLVIFTLSLAEQLVQAPEAKSEAPGLITPPSPSPLMRR